VPDRDGRAGAGSYHTLLCVVLGLWVPLGLQANDQPQRASADFELSLMLQDSEGAHSSRFAAGEPVTLVLTVRNRADAARSLSFPSAMTFDFSISRAAGGELWRRSNGRRFAQVLTDLHFAPGEAKRFVAEWEGIAADGTPAGPGSYHATAELATGAPRVVPASTSFTLK